MEFQEFYLHNLRRSVLFVKSYVHDDAVSSDIATESFVSLWEMMRDRDIDYPERVLFTILRNKSLNYLNHLRVRYDSFRDIAQIKKTELDIRISSLNACVPEKIFAEELRIRIDKIIDSLPDKTRRVFLLSRVDGLTNKEIAVKLEFSEKSVEYHMSKAIKAFRNLLSDYLPSVVALCLMFGISLSTYRSFIGNVCTSVISMVER